MPVSAKITVLADNPYGDEESGSVILTTSTLEPADYNSVEETYRAYVAFVKVTGFVVRKGNSVKDEEGNNMRKFFYCNRQGLHEKKHHERVDRKRAHKLETRTNCYAKCKGINSSLKKFIKSGNFLLELAENLDRVVKDYHNNEFIRDYKSLYTNPVLTIGLESLEGSASIPCGHIFCVLKELEIEDLPNRFVLKRWCKYAKSGQRVLLEAVLMQTMGDVAKGALGLVITAATVWQMKKTIRMSFVVGIRFQVESNLELWLEKRSGYLVFAVSQSACGCRR
ncbi:hypothetical protein AHAS_Ahas13G0214400 [Arachis hypogaea]